MDAGMLLLENLSWMMDDSCLLMAGLTMSGLALGMSVTLKGDGSFLMDPSKQEEEVRAIEKLWSLWKM